MKNEPSELNLCFIVVFFYIFFLVDMWSVGCIFAEMLGGKPLFKGRDYVDQLNQILQILGTPDEATLRRVGSERAQAYIRSLPRMPKIHFSQLYPNASPLAIDLLEKLLNFDPAARITVEQALAHPYLHAYHEEDDEPAHEQTFDFAFEVEDRIEDMKSKSSHWDWGLVVLSIRPWTFLF